MKAFIVLQKAETEPSVIFTVYLLHEFVLTNRCVCVCLLFVLQVRKWEQRWYSANLAAAASGLEEHSAGHADQITRVCVCARLSKVWRAAALTAQSRGLG